jgi:putative transposase
MVQYRRNYVPGGTFFFTVTLDDRRSSVLVDHVALLRAAFRKTRGERPFAIDAIVILPDHLHAIMTLPPGDSDFSDRWRRIKGAFTRGVVATGVAVSRDHRSEYNLWQKRFWEHTIRDDGDFERCADYIHFNPVKHGWCHRRQRGHFPRFTDTSVPACWREIGEALVSQTTSISVNAETDPGFRHRARIRAARWLHPGYKPTRRSFRSGRRPRARPGSGGRGRCRR